MLKGVLVRSIKESRGLVVLIHGLYSSPGFWVPAMDFLRQYDVYLVSIDYASLHPMNFKKKDLFNFASETCTKEGVEPVVIGHSLGALIAQFWPTKKSNIYSISPPFNLDLNLNADFFIKSAHEKSCVIAEDVGAEPLKIEFFEYLFQEFYECFLVKKNIYVADQDQYFDNKTVSLSNRFYGDHFEV